MRLVPSYSTATLGDLVSLRNITVVHSAKRVWNLNLITSVFGWVDKRDCLYFATAVSAAAVKD